MNKRMIAVCGLDCTNCDIRRVPTDAQAAQRIVGWFRSMGWLKENEGVPEIIERSMYCTGCRGDRALHWSADCWILQCCVDDKGLAFCHECHDFPCERLSEWASQNDRYAEALSQLQCMKEAAALDDLPLEFVVRFLPGGTFALLTAKGPEITSWEGDFYGQWLPSSGYQLAAFRDLNFQIQAYEAGRFKGAGDQLQESELDVYVPIEKNP